MIEATAASTGDGHPADTERFHVVQRQGQVGGVLVRRMALDLDAGCIERGQEVRLDRVEIADQEIDVEART